MDQAVLTEFFMWWTIIAGALYVFTAVMCVFRGDWIYRVQSRWFPIPKETFNVVLYCYVGLFKVLFIVFVLVPYLALLCVK
jgi:hypothetical protein